MAKRLVLLAMAIAAFAAMVIPASASGVTLTDSAGTVSTGAWIVATSTDTKITHTAVGDLFCPHVEMAAEVKTNNGFLVTASNGAVGPLHDCEAGGGANLTMTEPKLTHLETTGFDEGEAMLSFTADVGAFKCPFAGNVGFTFETGSTYNTLSLSETIFSQFLYCEEEEGEGEIPRFEGTYRLTTTVGSPLWMEP